MSGPGVEGAGGAKAAGRPGTDAAAPKASALQTVRAVFWSFFGVRKRADYESDVQQLNPRHVVIAGIVGAVLFVLALVTLVKWVIGSGVAAG
jgi:preprotein translocase subunit Sec61beta